LPDHDAFSAYFNLDTGAGRIRGIYAQGNVAVVPLFEAWLAPLADLGADTVTTRRTGGTDHLSFDRVGLPAFQFIQDPLDYSSRTHHTTWDVYEHVPAEDLVQASIVMAWFLYNAAMRDEPLPRGTPPRDAVRANATRQGASATNAPGPPPPAGSATGGGR
jgi:Zn-dependent M28 family amino/carboxypeptidase